MSKGTVVNHWNEDRFEDYVARAILALYETKVKKDKLRPQEDRIQEGDLLRMRSHGLYIPGPTRIFDAPMSFTEASHMGANDVIKPGEWTLDLVNDPLPACGTIALKNGNVLHPEEAGWTGYISVSSIIKRQMSGKGWVKQSGGSIYELVFMLPGDKAVQGDHRYFTVDKDGRVWACDKQVQTFLPGQAHGGRPVVNSEFRQRPKFQTETEAIAAMTIQMLNDRRFCWGIEAKEHRQIGSATLGCEREEIKSLLYARSLPMSETGRKRPILHLVEAHKRRLKNGIEIEIDSFLRGVPTVEIGGTLFTVRPPAVIKSAVSTNSQKFFAEPPMA